MPSKLYYATPILFVIALVQSIVKDDVFMSFLLVIGLVVVYVALKNE